MNAARPHTTRTRQLIGAAGAFVRALVTIIVIVVIVWMWPARFGGKTTLIAVSGNSMSPTIEPGQLALARRVDDYQVGDIVVYPIPGDGAGAGRLVIHRISESRADGTYTTRGDNRLTDDPWHPDDNDIVGRVLWHGGTTSWLRNTASILMHPLTIGAVAGLLTWWILKPDNDNPETVDLDEDSEPSGGEPDTANEPGTPAINGEVPDGHQLDGSVGAAVGAAP